MHARLLILVAGTYQVLAHRRQRFGAYYGWEVESRDVAGDLVLGVSGWEAQEEGVGYDPGGESVSCFV